MARKILIVERSAGEAIRLANLIFFHNLGCEILVAQDGKEVSEILTNGNSKKVVAVFVGDDLNETETVNIVCALHRDFPRSKLILIIHAAVQGLKKPPNIDALLPKEVCDGQNGQGFKKVLSEVGLI